MNKQKRLEFLKAMVLIGDHCRDDKAKDFWEINGIAPNIENEPEEDWLDFYTCDVHFAEVMHAFLLTMKKAAINGGIDFDGVSST